MPPTRFPDPRSANEDGLVWVGGELTVENLLAAYRGGIFPWTADPVSWWSPDPRGIFELDRFHVPKSLAKILRQKVFAVTVNKAFTEVMTGCAECAPGRQNTWVTPEFIAAYTRLHEQGHAHSVECWRDGRLAGGIYGVAIGGLFAGESMFHRESNASKVALAALAERLREKGFLVFDIQMVTAITRQLGAVQISREDYLRRLAAAIAKPCTFV